MQPTRLMFLSFLLIFISSPLLAQTNPISIKHINLRSFSDYDFLVNKGFKPRKDVDPWPFSLPIEWNTDPFEDRNWRFQLHAWRIIDPALQDYRKTTETRYLVAAIDIIEDWYDYHIVEEKQSDMQWYDMSAGIRAMKLAWLKNEIEIHPSVISKATATKINHLLEMHVEKLMDREYMSKGNHAYFQLVGLRLACSTIPSFKGCTQELEYNNQMMANLLSNQFTVQGVHRENSPAYHFFTIMTLKSLNISALYGDEVNQLIGKARTVSPWLTYPDKSIARIGDSSGKKTTKGLAGFPIKKVNGTDILIGDLMESGYFTIRTPTQVPVKQASQLFISGISKPINMRMNYPLNYSTKDN